eukprot:1123725-Amphidinium_carterae.1
MTSRVTVPNVCAVASDALAHTGRRKAVKLLRVPLYKDPACLHFTTPSPLTMSTVPRASHAPSCTYLVSGTEGRLRC